MQTIKDVPVAPETSVLIDIKAVKVINTKGVLSVELSDFGWTACPIIEDLFFQQDHGFYVVSGNFVLQIFKGPVPADLLPQMKTNPLWAAQLMLQSKEKPVILHPTAGMLVWVSDVQRLLNFSQNNNVNFVDYWYLTGAGTAY